MILVVICAHLHGRSIFRAIPYLGILTLFVSYAVQLCRVEIRSFHALPRNSTMEQRTLVQDKLPVENWCKFSVRFMC